MINYVFGFFISLFIHTAMLVSVFFISMSFTPKKAEYITIDISSFLSDYGALPEVEGKAGGQGILEEEMPDVTKESPVVPNKKKNVSKTDRIVKKEPQQKIIPEAANSTEKNEQISSLKDEEIKPGEEDREKSHNLDLASQTSVIEDINSEYDGSLHTGGNNAGGTGAGTGFGQTGTGSGAVNSGGGQADPFVASFLRAIDREKYYPASARRAGITGDVLIKVTFSKNGEILEMSLVPGNYHRTLSDATLKTMDNVKARWRVPAKEPEKAITLIVPVKYELN